MLDPRRVVLSEILAIAIGRASMSRFEPRRLGQLPQVDFGSLFLLRLPQALPCAHTILKRLLYRLGLLACLFTPSAGRAAESLGCLAPILGPCGHRVTGFLRGGASGCGCHPAAFALPQFEAMLERADRAVLAHTRETQPVLDDALTVGAARLTREVLERLGHGPKRLGVRFGGLANRVRDTRYIIHSCTPVYAKVCRLWSYRSTGNSRYSR